MGLSQALSTAMSGLRATQASLALVGSNVANAESPGYTKKTLNQVAGTTGEFGSSVLINGVNAAQTMAQQLNATSAGIQSLRANAETGINDSISVANNALTQIASINNQLQANGQTDASTAALLDQRDQYITQLSQLMDIRT